LFDDAAKAYHLTNIRKAFFSDDERAFLFMVKNSYYAWAANIDSINLHQ
jgi:hypothetical protein